MRLPGFLRPRSRIGPEQSYEFMVHMDVASMDRIRVISWLGFIMYVTLLGLDVYRWINGYILSSPNLRLLLYIHLGGLLYLVPAYLTTYASSWIKPSRTRRGSVIWYMFGVMTLILLGQAFVSYAEYKSLTLFIAYVIVTNWAFAMNMHQRIALNFCCVVIMSGYIWWIGGDIVHVIIKQYEIVFITIIAFIFHAFDYKLLLDNYLQKKSLTNEKARIEELESTKSRMYVNLTHEFRTPLTVISGMADKIREDAQKWTEQGTELIAQNARRMLNLVSQILELSKLESGNISLHLAKGDIISYLKYIIDSFQSYAANSGITLHFIPDIPILVMDYDPDKTLTIASNLLSNAIKFSPRGGHVYMRIAKNTHKTRELIEIRLRDTGPGIGSDQLPFIFQRFYRMPEHEAGTTGGTGIGLAIVKEMVALLGGRIRVESEVGVGTEFILTFPIMTHPDIAQAAIEPEIINSNVSVWFETTGDQENITDGPKGDPQELPQILIIEDSPAVITYITSVLEKDYHVTGSVLGKKGIELAIQLVPDLIITDLMLPDISGYEVCQVLKQDARSSHIPVIMLTARAESEARVAGFESGVDAYLTKPFNAQELLAQIAQIIRSRRALQSRYLRIAAEPTEELPESPTAEDAFIVRVRDAVKQRIDDPDLNVNKLCRAVGMSRTQLHNKIKALTGKSTTQIVRDIRLTEARRMLLGSDATVAQIAYETGFSDPGYFSRVFHEIHGETPSDFRERNA